MQLIPRLVLEAIGTFLLMLVIATVTVHGATTLEAALAIGAILLVLVYAIGPHSWAHFNPAMTLGFCLRGTTPFRELLPYTIAQCLGALLAVLFQSLLLAPAVAPEAVAVEAGETVVAMGGLGAVLAAEIAFTFALIFLTLQVATTRTQAGNQYFGLVVSMTVVSGILTMGPVASAVFNPAVQVGFWTMAIEGAPPGLVVISGNVAAAFLAALAFRGLHGRSEDPAG